MFVSFFVCFAFYFVLCFCIVLCIVAPHVYSCLFSICVQLYQPLETQLQLLNIISYHMTPHIGQLLVTTPDYSALNMNYVLNTEFIS
jgi:hypothetical protein